MSNLRSPVAPHLPSQEDWPTREQALSIIAALDRLEDGADGSLESLTGIPNAQFVAHNCYMIYGYPELEDTTFARRIGDLSMRPRGKTHHQRVGEPTAAPPDYSTGFTPRR